MGLRWPTSRARQAVRRRLAGLSGQQDLSERVAELEARLGSRIDQREQQLHEWRELTWGRQRRRRRERTPAPSLTWGAEISGDDFVEKARRYGALAPEKAVLEIGPGYGRLLAAILARGGGFESYTGIDLSEENVAHLRDRFGRDGVRFLVGDVETVELERPVDSVLSSLTFKHLFPSFERGLANLARQMAPGGVVVFDLIEGRRRYFEEDGVTYIRWYERPEVEAILRSVSLEPVTFDTVHHHPAMQRLLVVARKPS